MESLTKENFWSDLYEKYPSNMEQFRNWIDEYKRRVNWDDLFKLPSDRRPEADKDPFFNIDLAERQLEWDSRKVKYHDLPIAMQIGIFIQFTFETDKNNDFFDGSPVLDMEQFVAGIRDWFFYEHAAAMGETGTEPGFDFGNDDYELSN